jgi:ABC-2 type transport system permease protein
MRWFQVITAFNPLTYCAEMVRAAMVPQVPHIAPWISLLALLVAAALFTGTGVISFRRRAQS